MTAGRTRRLRVRADELQIGDMYIFKTSPAATVRAVEKRSTNTPGGTTVSRIWIRLDGFTAEQQAAPHSKHTVLRTEGVTA